MTNLGLYLATAIEMHRADEVCAGLGLSRVGLYRLITGKRKLTPALAHRLGTIFPQPASFWLWLAEEGK